MNNFFVLDIETVPNENLFVTLPNNIVKIDKRFTDPAKIEAVKWKKFATDPDLCTIRCLGIKELDKPGKLYNGLDLEKFFKENSNFNLITFDGKRFDLPVLIKSGLRGGLDLPYKKLIEMTGKYKSPGHYDLISICSFNGDMSVKKSLDNYLRIYLNIQKETIGNEFFQNASNEEIRKHCLQDLEYTEQLFKKFSFLI